MVAHTPLALLHRARTGQLPSEYWERGHQARMCPGYKLLHCPWPPTSHRGGQWLMGWMVAEDELAGLYSGLPQPTASPANGQPL